jgi:hypothetical protein
MLVTPLSKIDSISHKKITSILNYNQPDYDTLVSFNLIYFIYFN